MQEQHFIIGAKTVALGIKLRFYNKRDRHHKVNAYFQSNYLIVQQAKKVYIPRTEYNLFILIKNQCIVLFIKLLCIKRLHVWE